MANPRYIITGNTDSVTCCDCCGRSDLRRTVACVDVETGEEAFFGSVCAGKMLGWRGDVVDAKARAAARSAREAVAGYNDRVGRVAATGPVRAVASAAGGDVLVEEVTSRMVTGRHTGLGRVIIPMSDVYGWRLLPSPAGSGSFLPPVL